MDHQKVLELFDRQMRREARFGDASTRMECNDRIARHVGAERDWNAVVWSDLDGSTADAVIAEQVAFFRSLGVGFEWKLYGHDQPADLGDRLLAAGFAAEDPETVMVAAISELDLGVRPPDGVRLVRVTDAAGVELMVSVSEQAFGENADWLRHRLIAQLADDPDNAYLFVAMAGDLPVSAGRMDVNVQTSFASLWGGGTVEQWRSRGIYRALVAERGRIAADLGYEYLQVDATDQSRPILQRLGFAALTATTPFIMPAPVDAG